MNKLIAFLLGLQDRKPVDAGLFDPDFASCSWEDIMRTARELR